MANPDVAAIIDEIMTALKILSILVCIALVIGYANRRRPRLHVPIMLSAFLVDMAMVVYIELDRGAMATARAKMGPLMVVHIALSCVVILLYLGQIATGVRNLKGTRSRWHRHAGLWLILTRIGNLVTSFLVT